MLRGLPGIRHKSVQLACTVLVNTSTPGMHHLQDRSTKHHLRVWLQHLVLPVVHLAYLDEMQDASA